MGAVIRLGAPLLLAVVALGGCSPEVATQSVVVSGSDAAIKAPDSSSSATPDGGVTSTKVGITSVSPTHGPFVGGTALTIRGTGFTKATKVRIGGRNIQVGQTKWADSTKVTVVTPAGEVGPADVEVTVGSDKALLKAGYIYDPIYLDPSSGPTAGGTLVNVYGSGTKFKKGMKLILGGQAMSEVEVISATRARAKTPAGSVGVVDLTISGTAKDMVVQQVYSYYISTNPSSGGLGGGPIKGTLTISVLNASNRAPVDGATVVVDDAKGVKFKSKTGLKGVVVFTKSGLTGPLNITAVKTKFESTTIATVNARDVTILLFPIIPPSMGPGPPPKLAGTVSGYVMFGGKTGVGDNKWALVPEPKAGEVKRAYVMRSVPSLQSKILAPVSSATIDYKPGKATAWPYSMGTSPGRQAIYAVAGLYNKTKKTFVPHALGVTRGVTVGPGQSIKDLVVLVDIPLTRDIMVHFAKMPTSPKTYRVRLAIDLGADGYIIRADNEKKAVSVPPTYLKYAHMPAYSYKGLADSSYAVDGYFDGGGTWDKPYMPFVRGTMRSVHPKSGSIIMDNFIAPVTWTSPAKGGQVVNNTLTWKANGAKASVGLMVLLSYPAQAPVWRVITPGSTTSVKLPSKAVLGSTVFDSTKYYYWIQLMIHLPSHNFNKFNYSQLSSAYWDRWSQDYSYFRGQ